MSKPSDCPCLHCLADDLRLTEEFASQALAAERIADLTAKGVLLSSCYCANDIYFVCYRGVKSRNGILPRYEGEALDGP